MLSEKHLGERLRIGKNGKKKTAHLGGKCEANNGITPANRQKKTAQMGGWGGLKIDVHCVIEFGMSDIQHTLKILFVFGQFQNGNDG